MKRRRTVGGKRLTLVAIIEWGFACYSSIGENKVVLLRLLLYIHTHMYIHILFLVSKHWVVTTQQAKKKCGQYSMENLFVSTPHSQQQRMRLLCAKVSMQTKTWQKMFVCTCAKQCRIKAAGGPQHINSAGPLVKNTFEQVLNNKFNGHPCDYHKALNLVCTKT